MTTEYKAKCGFDAELEINGTHISSAIFDYLLNGGANDANLEYCPKKYRSLIKNTQAALSYTISGTDGIEREEYKAIVENHADDSDLVVVRKDGTISTPYHDPDDYNLMAEFLLWHESEREANGGLLPFVVWVTKACLEMDDPKEALGCLLRTGVECCNVFELNESEYHSLLDTGGRQPITDAIELSLGGKGVKPEKLRHLLKAWIEIHTL